jgi:hypothetical protein
LSTQQKKATIANQSAVDQAYQHFEQSLAPSGVKLNDPRTYNNNMKDMLHAFANYYYGSDYSTGPIIQKEINKIPVPTAVNPGSIRQYLDQTGKVFVDVNANVLAYQLAQQQAQQAEKEQQAAAAEKEQQSKQTQQTQQQGPQLAQGVSVVSADPVILRYGKHDYYIADDGMWHAMNNKNPVPDAWQQFFDQQAEIAEPQRQVVQQPAQPAQSVQQTQPVQPRFQQPAQQQTAPSPEEIRQQKQAAAAKRIQQELKPKIKLQPGETLDQAIARTRASR